MTIQLYDTTLRDGTQREGLSLSVADKLRIAHALDEFGIPFIEGGWPGSNPKDAEFFRRARQETWRQTTICAFGSTRHAQTRVEEDANIRALLEAETAICTIVGKSWTLHVTHVLETTLDENLRMIAESVAYLRAQGRRVFYDAEHFFDGYRADPDYALATIRAAADAGAEVVILCDTNGGSLPGWITRVVGEVAPRLACRVGIHTHNDGELAVANSLAAIEAGATHVQGTINGYGERCGNANLIPIIANLQLKMGRRVVTDEQLARLTELSRFVAAVANLNPDEHAAYVGRSAFAHKGGIHVAAVAKVEESYQHIDPRLVGNQRRVVVSELAGRGNVRMRAAELGLKLNGNERAVLQKIKEMENRGFMYEAAEGSFELLVRRADPDYAPPFEMLDAMVVVEQRQGRPMLAEATVKLRVNGEIMHTAAEGNGPVNALDQAMRKALLPHYPQLADVHLTDYKVRIIDEQSATAATTRVLIEAARGEERWSTVGCSTNIIEASWQALVDSLELPLLRDRDRQARFVARDAGPAVPAT
ncbi:citramalate synthase [Kallotenue papyrolyticum]|uniref:citramalate synthase n=1 Tax=Kallotenue papyrolyticum TaxID=1325125 RepID=UPI0004786025|nr:citramalate synthase [Kallotenue papyrolyticum]